LSTTGNFFIIYSRHVGSQILLREFPNFSDNMAQYYLILPMVGLKANVPHILDGILTLPPKSLPNPRTDAPLARRAASPPEEPPGLKSVLCGFLVSPKMGLLQSKLKVK
jgi:hypothetical protein